MQGNGGKFRVFRSFSTQYRALPTRPQYRCRLYRTTQSKRIPASACAGRHDEQSRLMPRDVIWRPRGSTHTAVGRTRIGRDTFPASCNTSFDLVCLPPTPSFRLGNKQASTRRFRSSALSFISWIPTFMCVLPWSALPAHVIARKARAPYAEVALSGLVVRSAVNVSAPIATPCDLSSIRPSLLVNVNLVSMKHPGAKSRILYMEACVSIRHPSIIRAVM